jgi:hypothetical protein
LKLVETRPMPRFFFVVRDGLREYPDDEGVELPSARAACRYAKLIARDLMFGREAKRRHWRVVVRNAGGEELRQVPFVVADRSLRHLRPDTRKLIERTCEKRFALAAAVNDARSSVYAARATLAHIRRRPYLVARDGQVINSPRMGGG